MYLMSDDWKDPAVDSMELVKAAPRSTTSQTFQELGKGSCEGKRSRSHMMLTSRKELPITLHAYAVYL